MSHAEEINSEVDTLIALCREGRSEDANRRLEELGSRDPGKAVEVYVGLAEYLLNG